jgi:hypothetical protein
MYGSSASKEYGSGGTVKAIVISPYWNSLELVKNYS